MAKCCSLISFQIKIDVINYIIAYWVCEIFYRLFCDFNWDYYQLTENNADNEYLYIVFGNISDFLSFFGLLYERIKKCQNDKEKKEDKIVEKKEEKDEREEHLIKDDNPELENSINNKQNEKLFQLLGILLLDLLSHFFYYIYHSIFDLNSINNKQNEKLFQLLGILLLDLLIIYLRFFQFFLYF